jgi:CRP-like cAMP-binding protein
MIINLGHAAYLVYERSLMKLTEQEQRLHNMSFPTLDRVLVKKLLRSGLWLKLEPGEFLTRQGHTSRYLYLIAEGEAIVRASNREIARLPPGRFVGEIGFLTTSAATASAIAAPSGGEEQPIRCLAWDQKKLRKRLARDTALKSVMYAAIGSDLSAKIADHNVKLMR